MAYAGLLIGFARAIFIVLDQGQVIDTIVSGHVRAALPGCRSRPRPPG